uniref:zinc ABC transporter substrate-binding protein n=2 Tax=Yoonia sp. TaxID=2212373 RepID=UPI004047FC30
MRLTATLIALLAASPALAVPNVLTDIAPINALVSEVMGDLGGPAMLLPPNTDGHDYTMRPSDAQAVSDAEVIIRVGDALTPWMSEVLANLAPDATVLTLLDTDGWTPRRVSVDGDPELGGIDPHAWLDPQIAAIWVERIAEVLATADPENADTYAQNAQAAAAEFAQLSETVAAQMATVSTQGFLWPHDAYQYFAARFDLTGVGAIAQSDASDPGPARIAALRELALSGQIDCVLLDTEINARWGQVLTDGTAIPMATVDPIGAGIELGRGFYRTLLTQLSSTLATCQ